MHGQSADATTVPINVAGVVVDANSGAPVPRALVQLDGRVMLTDHDGKFEFDQFARTRASLQVTKPGYYFSLEPMGNGSRVLTASQLVGSLTLRLYPEGLLTGTLTGTDGAPLRGISISAMRRAYQAGGIRWLPAGQATTNTRGEFRIAVSPGDYKLRTYHMMQNGADGDMVMPLLFPENSLGNTLDLINVHGGEEQHFDLHASAGRAFTVWLSCESSDSVMPMLQVRDANGDVFPVGAQISSGNLYRVQLPNGSYTLTATKYSPEGQQIAETDVTVAGHDVSGVVLRFQPLPTVPLEIQVDSGMSDNASTSVPLNPYELGLVLQQDSQDQDMQMVAALISPSQQNGEIGFRLRPGSYRLMARNAASQWYVASATYGDRDLLQQNMTVGPGNASTPIEVTVSNRTGVLNGTVSISGAQGKSWIYLLPTTPSASPEIMLQTNDSGVYRATLPPGAYKAIAFDQSYSFDPRDPNAFAPYSTHVKTVEIHSGDTATLDLEAVTQAELRP